ncbi:hypothetical protein CFY91_12570 [Pseudomonas fluvialis]|uniref:DUF4350 domain-containing protein n=1 Tax=Pseudomonas fluvialis TaxID=1793966 RepID=A0ABQ2AC15_9PSED|nr:DUF4350 domain-containing protein [Pseudomonas fluvialis]OXM39753.1 hypothetical protein CFY91_12570 [Pseudomonas fluvialis]GGH88709.1 hypothetical protein GCM10007363_02070 [Pseudomonas fluvialis]
MTTRQRQWLLGGLLLLALVGLGGYLFEQLQHYQSTVKHGPSPEARRNPYLAAEHFLRLQQIPVQRAANFSTLHDLPAMGHSLLVLGGRNKLSPTQQKRLLDWAARGGHLLFVAEALYDEERQASDDPLLDALGIQQYRTEELPEEHSEDSSAPRDNPHPELTRLYLQNEKAPAYIAFDDEFHLYDSQNRAHAWANSAAATHLLQLYHGQGMVSVLSDAWIWENDNISGYDHAWLLWYLTQDSQVTLFHDAERDGLGSLLLRHFPLALLLLALLLGAGLWHVAPRFGPLLPSADPTRRQLEEHLRGSADFLLRRAGQHSLLQGLQQDIQRRARHRQPGFERLPVAEQWQVLGRLSRLPSNAISQAMRPLGQQPLSAADFTRQVAHLQRLRNAL